MTDAASARAFGARLVAQSFRAAVDVLLPPRCLSCGETVAEPGALCGVCWPLLTFIAPPLCAICGFPFDYDPGNGAICGECLRETPPFERARTVLRYDEHSRDLVISFKHRDRTDAAPAYGKWMARAGAEILAEADLIIPVPLHRHRLISRRYNQSAELCHAMSRESSVPQNPDLLIRTRSTPTQGRLTRAERERNVRGAFALKPDAGSSVQGRRVVLVDDVLTTGATVNACTRTLLRGGAAAVDVLTLARVVRPGR
jgi:ComF family protein